MKGNIAVVAVIIVLFIGALGYAGFMVYQKETKIKEMEVERARLMTEQKKLSVEYQEQTESLRLMTADFTSLKEKLKQVQTAVEEKNADNAKLLKEVEIAKNDITGMKKEVKDLQALAESKDKKISGLAESKAGLEKKIEDRNKKLHEAQGKIKDLISTADSLKSKAEKTSRTAEEKTQKLSMVNAARSAWRGTVLLESGKPEEALKEYKAAVEGDPSNRQAFKGLALCYEALGRKEDARAWWENYIRTGPGNEEVEEARRHLDSLKE